MALDRQVITLPLAQGLDTKTDPKQVEAGKLLELENGVFTTLKAIRKRDGNVALGKTISTASGLSEIDAGRGLATYNNELLLADGQSLYSYDQGANAWTSKGPFVSLTVDKSAFVRNTYSQNNQDGATHSSGLQLYAWQETGSSPANSLWYSIVDGNTGQVVVPPTYLTGSAIKPRVIASGSNFLIYYCSTATTRLELFLIPVGSPLSAPQGYSLTTATADSNALNAGSPNYDVCQFGEYIAVAFNNGNAAGRTTVRMYSAVSPTSLVFPQNVISYRSRSIAIFPAYAGISGLGPCVAFSTDNNSLPYTTDVRYVQYTANLASVVSSAVVASSLADPSAAMMITGVSTDPTNYGFDLYYSSNYLGGTLAYWRFNSSFVGTGATPFRKTLFGVSKAFALDGYSYIAGVHQSSLQSTYFLVRGDGTSTSTLVAKALPSIAGPRPAQNTTVFASTDWVMPMPCSVSAIDADSFRMPLLEQALLAGNGLATATGVSALTFNFNDEQHSYAHATLGSNLHFSGGFVQMYDGVNVVEHGFHLYPEGSTATAVGSGGSLSAGQYTYAVCYEWIDQQNNIHRSAPDTGIAAVTTVNNDSVNVAIPYLQLTDKTGSRPVQLIVYRTQANGTILYRVTSLTAPTLNVLNGASTVTVVDTLSDTALALRPQLYCQYIQGAASGIPYELPNYPAPPTGHIWLHRNRIWVVDSTNPLQLWYSKECQIGAPVEFNDTFVKQIDPRGGPITALASADDKLLVFKESHIFFIVGQGPVATGLQNDLSDAILITTDCGCIDPRSVIGTPVGVMFQSRKGIYLIDRSLQVQYIGAPVDAYNAESITSAILAADTNQVRFTLGGGKSLVFDYFVQQWGTFTNQYAVDSIIWQNTPVMLRSNGTVLRQTSGVFTDDGSPIRLKLTTSWFSFAKLQGFQRVRRMQVLGAWKSAHNLQIDACVDFDDVPVQSVVVSPETPSAYGATSPYGNEVPYGGGFQLYQWRVDLARQKTQSVKFTIQDLPTATASGEGCSLSSIGFEVGAKVGLAKVPATRIAG